MLSVNRDTQADISIHDVTEAEMQSWAEKFNATITRIPRERFENASFLTIHIGNVSINLFT
jgi:hypothetical protein